MIAIEGDFVRLRAVEPSDIDRMYLWENDPSIWRVSGTLAPLSRHELERFVEEQRYDIFQSRQQRLMIETLAEGACVGTLDLFEIDPLNSRAGIGVMIYPAEAREQGYATDAVETVCRYARERLRLHQLWCEVAETNERSLRLFRRCGFEETGQRADWLWTPEGYLSAMFFQRLLD